MEEQTIMVQIKGGYKSQLSDDTSRDYIRTYQPTEDPPGDVNSDGRCSSSFEGSSSKRTSCHAVKSRRYPITFETREKVRSQRVYDEQKCGQ